MAWELETARFGIRGSMILQFFALKLARTEKKIFLLGYGLTWNKEFSSTLSLSTVYKSRWRTFCK
jgi:hypothetical protein